MGLRLDLARSLEVAGCGACGRHGDGRGRLAIPVAAITELVTGQTCRRTSRLVGLSVLVMRAPLPEGAGAASQPYAAVRSRVVWFPIASSQRSRDIAADRRWRPLDAAGCRWAPGVLGPTACRRDWGARAPDRRS